MGINRAPFNALVDDDGSGKVGTVWNKAQIAGVLLDPIDALVSGGWNVLGSTLTADAGSWSSPAPWMKYKRIDKSVFVFYSFENCALSGSPAHLYATVPFPSVSSPGVLSSAWAWIYHPGVGIIMPAYSELQSGTNYIQIQRMDLSAIPAIGSGLYVRGQFMYDTP